MATLKMPTATGAILLPETTLFPHGALPLHIFEPRYRQMLSDALEGDCFFCVGTLTAEETADPADCVAPVGTVGLIRASHEQPDGRSEMLLHGVCRIHFRKWHHDRAYPFAEIEPFHSVDIPERHAERELNRLRTSVAAVAAKLSDELGLAITRTLDRIDDPFTATDAMAQQFVADPAKRRALLEEPSVGQRLDQLVDYLDGLEI